MPFLRPLLLLSLTLLQCPAEDQTYPPHAQIVDVTRSPYGAKGDGVTDDTGALQRALNENVGQHRVLYFPNGTYLVSRTLTWPKRWENHDNWGQTMLRGQSREKSVLRLKEGTFTDVKKPEALMWCGGFGSADWFHNYVENLTFDVGNGNPGGTALQFYSNNTGAVRDCRFIAGTDSGAVGLDLAHRDMNGPLLVQRCEVHGFRCGILTARAVNSQTFEDIQLHGQREIGFANEGQSISIRHLVSNNAVPALSSYGTLVLLDSTLQGRGDALQSPAVVNFNGGRIFLRDVKTSGYKRALADITTPDFAAAYRIEGADRPGSAGPDIAEYSSTQPTSAFPSPAKSLRLPIKEMPRASWEAPQRWAVVDDFGADPTAQRDSSAAVQKALDSGATTVFLPGSYTLSTTVRIRGNVQRVVSVSGMVNYGKYDRPDFRIEDGAAAILTMENFGNLSGGIEIATRRTVCLRSMEVRRVFCTPASRDGEIFLEDVVGDDFRFEKQRVWARQFNIENEGTHLTNTSGDLWVLGYKTERGGTLLKTLGGGRSEILGGLSYTTTAGKLAPMFVNEDASVWAYFAEVCYSGDPFATIIRETRAQETKTIEKNSGQPLPYSGYLEPP